MNTNSRILTLTLALILAFSLTGSASAAGSRSFIGIWRAIDIYDESLIQVTIAGPARGPFQITWKETFFSFCDGRAGFTSGIGWLDPDEPFTLEADMRLTCLRTGNTREWHQVWQYRSTFDVLTSQGDYGVETIWTRPGRPLVPRLDLRVNYGHDWVESFYQAGHKVRLTLKDGDGNIKAKAQVTTESKAFWGGETGFQTEAAHWYPAQPDIQPFDWVYAQVDNGQTARVQIGAINGMIDLAADSTTGTINAAWFSEDVEVECHSWGAPLPEEILKYDMTLPNGEDTYICSWLGEWDIQPGQEVGVGYLGPDGHWVANAFTAPHPRIVASEAGDWYWVTEFYPGPLNLFIYESSEEGAALLWSGQQEAIDLWGITIVGIDVHGQDLLPGNYLVVSDEVNEKGLVLEKITMEVFDTENEIMAGAAPPGREVWAMAGPQDWQQPLRVQADPESGAWLADFKTLPEPFDITEEMRPWSFAHIYDDDGDANEANPAPLND